MTYNVFGGTMNLTQPSTSVSSLLVIKIVFTKDEVLHLHMFESKRQTFECKITQYFRPSLAKHSDLTR